VGSLEGQANPFEYYHELGHRTYAEIVDRLPPGWSFNEKRILDFGCGAGRTLRHFVREAEVSEAWGCDIDEASVSWLRENLCPPFKTFLNGPEPPLSQPSSSFDLIWGISVFTHLTDSWSRWLTELHRVLKNDGLLYLTFMGSGMSEIIAGEPWDEDAVGMNVLKYGQSWDLGGPMVMHSPWWIEEHWGRGFEILSLSPAGFANDDSLGHGSVLMRKRDVAITPDILEQVAVTEERETRALLHNVGQLHQESVGLRYELDVARASASEAAGKMGALEAQISDLHRRLATIERSKSWNLTRPLRAIARQVRAARS
jgi:SAM-dependent methyltransferase